MKWLVKDLSVWQIMFVRSGVILLLISLANGFKPFPQAYRSPVRGLLGMHALVIVAALAEPTSVNMVTTNLGPPPPLSHA